MLMTTIQENCLGTSESMEHCEQNQSEDNCKLLAAALTRVPESSLIWALVKDRVLPDLQPWDVILAKAKSKSKQNSVGQSKKQVQAMFFNVLSELQLLLDELKVFVSDCTEETMGDVDSELTLSPELYRLCEIGPPDKKLSMKSLEKISPVYQQYFSDNSVIVDVKNEEHSPAKIETQLDFDSPSIMPKFGYNHECLKCGRAYKKSHHLERHSAKCSGIAAPNRKPLWAKDSNTGRFSCAVPGCLATKSWTTSFSVWHHFNAEHADMNDDAYCVFKCDIDLCEAKFPNRSMLTRHKSSKHEQLFRFQCPHCDKMLASNKLLKLHVTQHTGEKAFACDLCDYRAITKSIVNQHKLRMHEGSIPDRVQPKHVCEVCGKSFKVRSNLKEHMNTHTSDRSFLCGLCGKALKNRQCLNRHMWTHGVKQTCPECGKNFANQSSLNIHIRDKHKVVNKL